jgi:hypothetical protein
VRWNEPTLMNEQTDSSRIHTAQGRPADLRALFAQGAYPSLSTAGLREQTEGSEPELVAARSVRNEEQGTIIRPSEIAETEVNMLGSTERDPRSTPGVLRTPRLMGGVTEPRTDSRADVSKRICYW